MKQADQIVQMIMSYPETCEDGGLVNELLRQFHRGYPVKNLEPMLSSDDDRIVKTGIWLASELGSQAAVVLQHVSRLLTHPSRYVRYYAVDCMLTCTTRKNESELGAVISMLVDTDAVVRWEVLNFMSRATREQLQGALDYFLRHDPDSFHAGGLRWLLGQGGQDPVEVVSFLKSGNDLLRKYAVVAASRMAAFVSEPLVLACSSEDEDVRTFATDALNRLPHTC